MTDSGYLAPEYTMWGHVSFKTDVYSFGVLVLETVKRVRKSVSMTKFCDGRIVYVTLRDLFSKCKHIPTFSNQSHTA